MELYYLAGAVVCAVFAAVWDLRTSRIPNRLTYTAMVAGLILRGAGGGWRGLVEGFAAGLLLGGIFLAFFLVRAMGAGDVKLMAAVGCFTGLRLGLVALLATALAGGVLALGYAVFRRRTMRTLRNVASLLRYHLIFKLQPHPEVNLQNPEAVRVPYAVAIATGTVYTLGQIIWRR
jgi:prepilin peptidase CpaA